MIKTINLLILCFFGLIANLKAAEHITPPKKTIYYECRCKTPNVQGICRAFKKDAETPSAKSAPIALTLSGGWIIQPNNCVNKQKYTLTAGSVLFSGKKIAALYDKLKSPLSNVGYVYHATPNLPYTRKNYSMIVVKNSAIRGINLKNSQWQCGFGNGATSCHSKWNNARCFLGNEGDFIYAAQ